MIIIWFIIFRFMQQMYKQPQPRRSCSVNNRIQRQHEFISTNAAYHLKITNLQKSTLPTYNILSPDFVKNRLTHQVVRYSFVHHQVLFTRSGEKKSYIMVSYVFTMIFIYPHLYPYNRDIQKIRELSTIV